MDTSSITRTEFATLHDCFSGEITETSQNIIFKFFDGFWINVFDIDNNCLGTYSSKESNVIIHNAKLVDIELHNNTDLKVSWEELKKYVNLNRWKLEFLSEERTKNLVKYTCFLWYNDGKSEFLTFSFSYKNIEEIYVDIDYSKKW